MLLSEYIQTEYSLAKLLPATPSFFLSNRFQRHIVCMRAKIGVHIHEPGHVVGAFGVEDVDDMPDTVDRSGVQDMIFNVDIMNEHNTDISAGQSSTR